MLDLAMQCTGSVGEVFELAAANNNKSITEQMEPGTMLRSIAAKKESEAIAEYYAVNSIIPASDEPEVV